ncbi:hypothetical protein BG011_008078 [Mortierella polycephala]|uniref:Uncharacterized protein n=1 Tax=Mortierella polycephala TaxID=41804 RepID=A0A9P6PRX9_9FUNG|nr:hypothetical protein BG011_008078 [Mortierella polycephala]
MLMRRNTIHPFTRHSNPLLPDSDHPVASPTKPTSTNPFLDTLHGDDSETQPLTRQEYINTTLQISPTTNPFLSDTSTYSSASFIHENTKDSEYWKDNVEENKAAQQGKNIKDRIHKLYQQYSPLNNQQYLPHHRPRRPSDDQIGAAHSHSRRMSLDLFKAPFAWNRQRHATCTASDPKRTPTQGMPSFGKQQHNEDTGNYTARDWHTESDSGNTSSDEILKSSRYYPQEEEQIYYSGQQQDSNQDQNQDQNSETDLLSGTQAGENNTHAPPLPSTTTEYGPLEYRRDLQATAPTCDETEAIDRSRRRHSVFSDWSIEDCPRLLALQKKQLQAEQDQVHQSLSSSKTSLTRSRTDTTLDQHHGHSLLQHRRHTSVQYPHPTRQDFSQSNAIHENRHRRRNSVVIGRNLTRQHSPQLVSSENAPSHHYAKTVSDGVEAHPNTYDTNQDPWAAAATPTLHPLERTWQPKSSLTRRESQSYAHDFMRESELSRLRPWTATSSTYAYSYSSSRSSPVSSPVHQRMFPHECDFEGQVDYTPSEEEFSQNQVDRPLDTQPVYREVEHNQVYEQDYNEYDHNSGYNEPTNHNDVNSMEQPGDRFVEEHDFSCHENEHDRLYTDLVQWQDDNFVNDQEAKLESKQTRSQDILSRKATVAKKKLYKLLNYTRQRHDQPDKIYSDDGDNNHQHHHHHHYEVSCDCGDGSGNDQSGNDSSRLTSSKYSFKSSLRARVRLTQTKTALRQAKRRLSDAARTLVSDANKAASSMTPLLRSQGSKCHRCDHGGMVNVSESSIKSGKGIESVAEER